MKNDKKSKIFQLFIIGFSALIVIVSILTISNANNLKYAIDKKTENYLRDVSFQISQLTKLRLQQITTTLEELGTDYMISHNSLLFLQECFPELSFTNIAVVDIDGSVQFLNGTEEELEDPLLIQSALENESNVFLSEDHTKFIFSVQMKHQEQISGAMIGFTSTNDLAFLLDNNAFNKRGQFCIIDQSGNLILAAQSAKIIKQIYKDDESILSSIWEQKMKTDLEKQRSGIISIVLDDGTDILLAYHPIQLYGWSVLTMIPSDVISADTNCYTSHNFIITFVSIMLFILLFLSFVKMQQHYQKKLKTLAYVDPVTQGMNITQFQIHAKEFIYLRPKSTYAFVSLNIQNFKMINDTYGSQEGNKTLKYIYQKLSADLNEYEELVTRCTADTFYMLLRYISRTQIKDRIKQYIKEINSFNLQLETPYYLTLVTGVYIIDNYSVDMITIQDRATVARKSAQNDSYDFCIFYDKLKHNQMLQENDLNNMMKKSIENHDFKMYLQPKVSLKDRKVSGAEALVRWMHPVRGLIFPNAFIPIFERNDSICQLDLYMFEEVCRILEKWISEGKEVFPISVNISRQHLKHKNFLDKFKKIHQRYQIPANLIEMELTESILFQGDEITNAKQVVDDIHKMGFLCSLDDFGSGYSSLGILKNLHVDALKLDRCFFVGKEQEERGLHVVESVINLTKKLNVQSIAEGIDDYSQLKYLQEIQCDIVQGYIFSKPMTVYDFENFSYCQNKIKTIDPNL